MRTTITGEEYLTDGESVVVVNYKGSVGSARCHPDDKFSYDIGFKLAKSRAMEKQAMVLQAHAKTLRRMAYQEINRKEKA